MAILSVNEPVRRQDPTQTSSRSPGNPSRLQRTEALVALVCDATLSFVRRFIDRRDPLGRELTSEAEAAVSTSQGSDPRLPASGPTAPDRLAACRLNTAHLLTALELFLDQRRLRRWMKDDPESRQVRTVGQRCSVGQVGHRSPAGAATYAEWLEQSDPGVVANTIICLLHQTNYLLDRQILLLAQGFRLAPDARRDQADATARREDDAPPVQVPACPVCDLPMIQRTARRGVRAGEHFWGCTGYPRCHGLRAIEKKAADFRPRP